MAISDTQKVDLLFKKVGFGVTKSDDASSKSPANETISSPVPTYANDIWAEAGDIPSLPPASDTPIVSVYKNGSSNSYITLTADATSTPNRTWLTNLADWIPFTFNANYAVSVYVGSSYATATKIFPDGSGNDDEFYFDYQSGTLHFIGNNIPSGVAGNNVYIEGYRYVGAKGLGSSSGTSSKIYTVSDIAARDALNVFAGDMAWVQDAGNSNAEWGMYLATSDGGGSGVWIQIIDEDASDVDTRTLVETVDMTTDTTISLGYLSADRRITSIAVDVVTPFDTASTLTVGDSVVTDRLMEADENDLQDTTLDNTFMVFPTHTYSAETEVNIYFVANGNTTGEATVTVSYT